MVSPPFKQGYPVFGASSFSAGVSSEGAPLYLGSSLGVFAGASEAYSDGNDYAFRRTASGWTTTPLDPQLSEYVVNNNGGQPDRAAMAISGTAESLMELRTPAESVDSSNLYRVVPGTSPTFIGPLLPPSTIPDESESGLVTPPAQNVTFAGATPNLSHLLYYIVPETEEGLPAGKTNLWPPDSTLTGNTRSLYEYVGSGHSGRGGDQPQLVGVRDSGELISQCGTTLGGAKSGSVHDAISEDGDIIYFTAAPGGCEGTAPAGAFGIGAGPEVAELYARVDGEQTVAISEPSHADCEECLTSPGSRAAGTFEGATSNGEVVFFSTSQELLPGATGRNLYEFNLLGPPGKKVTLLSRPAVGEAGVLGTGALSADANELYFVAEGALAGENNAHRAPETGVPNLYAYRRECGEEASCAAPKHAITFVASLAPGDSSEWEPVTGAAMNLTPDGNVLVFTSAADLTSDDHSTAQQIFRYEASNETLTRVSAGNEGFNEDGNTSTFPATLPTSTNSGQVGAERMLGLSSHPAVSDDGAVVVFQSGDALTPGATQDPAGEAQNVYEYRDGHVYLISDGVDATVTELGVAGSAVEGVSGSGADVFFETYASLLREDTDAEADFYDARRLGGFAPPNTEAPCEASACQTPSQNPPPFAEAPSSSLGPEAPAAIRTTPAHPPAAGNASKLKKALRQCRRRHRKSVRRRCEAAAKHRYAPKRLPTKPTTSTSGKGGTR